MAIDKDVLAVERLVLAELLEQDHREQARPHQPAWRRMERRRRLDDTLACAAGEALAHGLNGRLTPSGGGTSLWTERP